MVAFLLSSLIGTAVLGAALLKLAAFLFKRTQLRWKHAVVWGLVAGAVGLVFGTLANNVPQPLVAASVYAAAVGVHVWFAGWFLGSRANRQNAEPLGFKGGVALAIIAMALMFVIAILIFSVLPVSPSHTGA
jgi:hypothetical protein